MQSTELDLTADIIDVRDVIARLETLEDECDDTSALNTPEARAELAALRALLDELKGYGGDEQWRGDWYPSQLIDDAYFVEYTQDLLADCGTIPRDLPSWVEIDWERTARNIREDYSTVDVDGRTYWYR